ncbi:MAG: TIM44-like domain-containing protein [Proteobacteria bacterium]|nr:TIM44-like domain-containing protein [Pseudomonadota bacterium]
MKRYRWLIAFAAIATIFTLVAADHADARAGRGFSSGSRGARTFSAPAATPTAPRAAQPLQRSTTQPSTAATGTAAAGQAARPGLFGGGLLGGLAAGFLGAGLFGMLFGHGFLGGMGGFASFLGLILQVVLVIVVARLAFAWWQRRNQPAYAMQAASPDTGAARAAPGALGGGFGGLFGGGAAAPAGEPITIDKQDYDDFERLLSDVQAAYSAEDLNALRSKATPEMVSYFAEDMAENSSRGLVNQVTDVKLLQGDLAEAWREGGDDYATVAMRFALTDSMIERASGRVVEGGTPGEATELWTFRRSRGGHWMLSAIQQA